MATLSKHIDELASSTGLEKTTLTSIGRRLREAGLVQINGRGLSAAHMTPRCVATLVTALLIPCKQREIVDVLSKYMQMPLVSWDESRFFPKELRDEWIRGTFGDVLTKLIEHSALDTDITLSVEHPIPKATIALWWFGRGKSQQSSATYAGEGWRYPGVIKTVTEHDMVTLMGQRLTLNPSLRSCDWVPTNAREHDRRKRTSIPALSVMV